MAEITTRVITTTVGTTIETTGTTVTAITRVESLRGDCPDVSVLRDLVRALDRVGAPNTAKIFLTSTRIDVEWRHDPVGVPDERESTNDRDY